MRYLNLLVALESVLAARTYNGGNCVKTDEELNSLRLAKIDSFSGLLLQLGESTSCFNMATFKTQLFEVLKPNVVGRALYGLGVYKGIY
jgi:hypothetical protein